MTFRGRLTAFVAAIVLSPLVAGGLVVHALAQRQAVHDAETRLDGMEISALLLLAQTGDAPRRALDDPRFLGGIDRGFLERLAVPSMTIERGRIVVSTLADAPSRVPSSRFFSLPGGLRGLCVCTGTPPSGIVMAARPRAVGALPALPWWMLLLILAAAALATLLASELARVLSKAHERALDRLVIIEHLSFTDALTGIPNRRHLESVLADETTRAARFDRPFSVLMIDVDHFKRINDTLGHAAGDRVLVEMAERLRRLLRTDLDTVARLGGEEFTVVLPETARAGALVVAEKLRSAVSAAASRDGHPVTVSVGVACRPQDGVTGDELLGAADRALYEAKRTGRDRVVAATSPAPV